jgi:hypothetical protein
VRAESKLALIMPNVSNFSEANAQPKITSAASNEDFFEQREQTIEHYLVNLC